MKFIIDQQVFQKILTSFYKISYYSSGIKNRSTFITAKKDSLLFFVQNDTVALERKISSSEKLVILSTGKVIINTFILNELVQKTREKIIFEVIEDSTIIIKTTSYRTKLNAVDFSFWQENNYEKPALKKTVFPNEDVGKLINQVAYAVDHKDGNYIFKGVNFRTKENKLLAVATDGSRIVEKSFFSPGFDCNFIVPANTLVELNRINNLEKKATINFSISENKKTKKVEFISFLFDDEIKFYSHLIEGEFPNTDKQFFSNLTAKVICSTEKLIAAIEKASIIFEKNSLPTVVLKIVDKKFFVSSLEKSEIGFFEEEVPLEKTDHLNEQSVNLQAKLVLTTLKSFSPGQTEIAFSGHNDPVLFSSYQDQGLRALILPLWIY